MAHTHDHSPSSDSHSATEHELEHLKTDARVLGGVGTAAVVSELAGVSVLKTGFSLGGEDFWWVAKEVRKAWQKSDGGYARKSLAALSASKFSMGVLVGVIAATPAINEVIETQPDLPAATTFTMTSVAISTASMLEGMWTERKAGEEPSEHTRNERRFRTEGITLTILGGLALHKQIGDGNPFVMPVVGGFDCLWTAARSWRYAKAHESNEAVSVQCETTDRSSHDH